MPKRLRTRRDPAIRSGLEYGDAPAPFLEGGVRFAGAMLQAYDFFFG
jgi:hypothetical protein